MQVEHALDSSMVSSRVDLGACEGDGGEFDGFEKVLGDWR
jgi:hypothetical protein